MRTRRCGFPTSGPRSGRLRWWRSWRAAVAAARAAAAWSCRRSTLQHGRCGWPPPTTPRASSTGSARAREGCREGGVARRGALRYPPFGNLIRIVCLSEEPGPEVEAAVALRALIALEDAQILGPAPIFRLQGRERSQIVVKAADRAAAVVAVRRAVEAVAADRRHKGVALAVDVDPQ